MWRNVIPVIDMEEVSLGEKMVEAMEEWGCFRLINHGIPLQLMSQMKSVTRSLTDLPIEIKQKNSGSDSTNGYTPQNLASPFFEALTLYDVTSPGAIHHFCSQIAASSYQREVVEKYCACIENLAELLGRRMMEGLGDDEVKLNVKEWACQLKMNKYNYSPESVGLTGAIMHSDPGFFTIVQDDEDVKGLEAMHNITGEMISLDPIPGSFVVNAGDVAHVLSNGNFLNVKHRVQCFEPTVRTSIAFFIFAPRDGKVQVLKNNHNPPLYNPFDFEEYRKLRISTKSPVGEALQYFLNKS